jgi:hypothetical protein
MSGMGSVLSEVGWVVLAGQEGSMGTQYIVFGAVCIFRAPIEYIWHLDSPLIHAQYALAHV